MAAFSRIAQMFSRGLSRSLGLALLAVIYTVAAKLSLHLAFFQPNASPVWPPAGIALAAMLILGYRVWPAIFVGAFLANVTTAGNLITSLCIAGGNSLEALCGAWLINRFANRREVFERAQDVFKFVLIAVISAAISASIGPAALTLAGFAAPEYFRAIWFTWWVGDVTGYLIVAPLVFLWWVRPQWRENGRRTIEAILLFVVLTVLAETVFGGWFPGFIKNYPLGFICGPIILWTAFRFTQREAITQVFLLSSIALWGTLHGQGPYQMGSANQSLLNLQLWAIVLTLTTMILASAMAERRRVETELEKQKAAVEAANRTKDKFIAMLSHELRTPLTPVLALVDMLEDDSGTTGSVRSNLAVIRRNIELESRLIDDLLDLTRVARGKLSLELKRIDAHGAINQAIEMCRSEIKEGRLNLRVDLKAQSSYVAADSAKFQQIIWNLLKNAIKFTPADGEITISSCNQDLKTLTITVRDTGIGIEPEQLERVFEAFEQGAQPSPAGKGGLGLGLAISRAIARAHGASLIAISDGHDHGTTFRLTMPVVHVADVALDRQLEERREPSMQSLRILLVEDHADTSSALGRLLTRRGHQLTVAPDIRTALAQAERGSFDLLISDLGLPDGTGFELMSKLRATGLRGIAISGYGMRSDIEKSLQAGFSRHLVKPLNFAALEAAIQETMNGAAGGLSK
jgi:signal transduction histidine kinase/CheY-like chemotaxis protein